MLSPASDRWTSVPSWLAPAVVAVALHSALLMAYVAGLGGDVSILVCANENVVGRPPFEAVRVGRHGGYDGQFCYLLAQAPWRHQAEGLDVPAYRHARVLYPALAWLLGGGSQRAILWSLPAVNLLAIGGLAGLAASLASRQGLSPWWGLALPLAVNQGLGALRDLTDPLAIMAVGGLLITWLRGGGALTLAAWAVAAIFSRQENVVVVGILGLAALGARQWRPALGLFAAGVAFGAWALLLRASYHAWPVLPAAAGNFTLPLTGLCHRWRHLAGDSGHPRSALLHGLRLSHLLLQMALALYLLRQPCAGVLKATMLAGLALALTAGPPIYCDAWSYTRVFAWLPLGIGLASLQLRRRWCLTALLPAALGPLVAVIQAWH